MNKIIESDIFKHLPEGKYDGLVASIPELSELGECTAEQYVEFTTKFLGYCDAVTADSHIIFYQTDRFKGGGVISKFNLICSNAPAGWKLLWHKISLRRDVGKRDLYMPTFSHVFCFGKGNAKKGKATPDVFPSGKPMWKNGMGVNAASVIALYLATANRNNVLDAFCGNGSISYALALKGVGSTGVDIDPELCAQAEAALATLNGGLFAVGANSPK